MRLLVGQADEWVPPPAEEEREAASRDGDGDGDGDGAAGWPGTAEELKQARSMSMDQYVLPAFPLCIFVTTC